MERALTDDEETSRMGKQMQRLHRTVTIERLITSPASIPPITPNVTLSYHRPDSRLLHLLWHLHLARAPHHPFDLPFSKVVRCD